MDLRQTLKPHLTGWPDMDNLDPLRFEINRLISQLDDVAVGYEAKWGVGKLESIAHLHDGDLAQKWQRHIDKLNDAILALDGGAVRQLVEGCLVGYQKLEEAAVRAAVAPCEPVYFEVNVNSTIYRIVKNVSDSRSLHRPGEKAVIVTAEEMARLFDKQRANCYHKRLDNPDKVLKIDDFDFTKGDEIPEF